MNIFQEYKLVPKLGINKFDWWVHIWWLTIEDGKRQLFTLHTICIPRAVFDTQFNNVVFFRWKRGSDTNETKNLPYFFAFVKCASNVIFSCSFKALFSLANSHKVVVFHMVFGITTFSISTIFFLRTPRKLLSISCFKSKSLMFLSIYSIGKININYQL